MLAMRLETPLIHEIDLLAKIKHTNRSSIIREAIIRFLEDNEDLALAKESIKKAKSNKSLKILRKELAWIVKINDFAEKQIKKLDKQIQKRILDYLDDRIEGCKNPRHFGEPLKGDKSGLWRYRMGDYRIICEIQDEKLIVLAITVGHRREIYK